MEKTSVVASASASASSPPQPHEGLYDVIIVGGGIAGLSTALALHRLGVKPVILEQSQHLRSSGAGIAMWTNAWKVLETLGVADNLRHKFFRISRFELWLTSGEKLAGFDLQSEERDVELRPVERKALLEALREALPEDMVFYDAQVTDIRQVDKGYTEVECSNGWIMTTKVLIGCDGIGSVVAKWMGFKRARYAGYRATRGVAEYPDGHNLQPTFRQVIGNSTGVRVGILPMDSKRVFWFQVYNAPSTAADGGDKKWKANNARVMREEALQRVKGWPEAVVETISRTREEVVHVSEVSDRWMWPPGWPFAAAMHKGGVTLTGDAMHPITPNLGQGGCCALEDSVVLARELAAAMAAAAQSYSIGGGGGVSAEMAAIESALKKYTETRWRRMLPIGVRSYALGLLLQLRHRWACSLRNALLPKILTVDAFTDHTYYDCGALE